MNNLDIWLHASKTDPDATKTSNVGGHKQTSISGYWMIQKATELWGPIGYKWGYEILEDRLEEGQPIYKQAGPEEVEIAKTLTHTIKLRLWYMMEDKECSIVQYGHTPYVYRSKHGATTDTEAPKKSLTDALKKALSMLGFCSDVFMGMHDDRGYVESIRTEFDIEKADDADAELDAKRNEFSEWAKKELGAYELIANPAALRAVLNGHLKKISRQAHLVNMDPQAVAAKFQKAHDSALEKLNQTQIGNA